MKKIIFSIISSLAFVQGHGALSNLNESLFEYETIISSSLLQQTLTQSEFIVDIKRKTKSLNATTVRYEVVTRTPRSLLEGNSSHFGMESDLALYTNHHNGKHDDDDESPLHQNHHNGKHDDESPLHQAHHNGNRDIVKRYIVKLNIVPNTLIGPPTITVVSVKSLRGKTIFLNNAQVDDEKVVNDTEKELIDIE